MGAGQCRECTPPRRCLVSSLSEIGGFAATTVRQKARTLHEGAGFSFSVSHHRVDADVSRF